MFPSLAAGELPSGLRLAGRLRSYRGLEVRGVCIDQATLRRGITRWTVRPTHDEQNFRSAQLKKGDRIA